VSDGIFASHVCPHQVRGEAGISRIEMRELRPGNKVERSDFYLCDACTLRLADFLHSLSKVRLPDA
jgi:hypothetical protein